MGKVIGFLQPFILSNIYLFLGSNDSLGVREKVRINDIDNRIWVKGKLKSCLFGNGKSLTYPLPSTQATFQSIDIAW